MSQEELRTIQSETLGRVLPIDQLTERMRDEMFALLETYFLDADQKVFERDLLGKERVIVLESRDGHVVGFSTQVTRTVATDTGDAFVVYSGDTIIDVAHRGSIALVQLGTKTIVGSGRASGLPAYWMVLSSGFRTYRFMPLIFRDYFPRPAGCANADLPGKAAGFASAFFGDAFDATTGIVRVEGASTLRPELADDEETARRDKHGCFFVEVNPGHALGDELVCCASLDESNLSRAAQRMLGA
jgi:hypothetical protein